MIVTQNVNIFLELDQYKSVKRLAQDLDVPYVTLIRQGIDLVLERHHGRATKKAQV